MLELRTTLLSVMKSPAQLFMLQPDVIQTQSTDITVAPIHESAIICPAGCWKSEIVSIISDSSSNSEAQLRKASTDP